MSEPEPVTLEGFKQWIERFMEYADEPKLVMCGPNFMWTITGKFKPENWPNFRGNAHGRRVVRRHYSRMWEILRTLEINQIQP